VPVPAMCLRTTSPEQAFCSKLCQQVLERIALSVRRRNLPVKGGRLFTRSGGVRPQIRSPTDPASSFCRCLACFAAAPIPITASRELSLTVSYNRRPMSAPSSSRNWRGEQNPPEA